MRSGKFFIWNTQAENLLCSELKEEEFIQFPMLLARKLQVVHKKVRGFDRGIQISSFYLFEYHDQTRSTSFLDFFSNCLD